MRTPSPRAGTLRSRPVEGFSRTTVETFVPAPLPPDPPLEFTRELHAELTDVRARLAYLEGLAEGLAGGFEWMLSTFVAPRERLKAGTS